VINGKIATIVESQLPPPKYLPDLTHHHMMG
jgi:hypothetical protein